MVADRQQRCLDTRSGTSDNRIMRFWRRDRTQAASESEPELEATETRRPAQWCSRCRTRSGPFAYFENGHDYCVPCGRAIHALMGVRSAGRRADDVQIP
jgi:hypothetical protein